jgi:cell shape-determining protein MreC
MGKSTKRSWDRLRLLLMLVALSAFLFLMPTRFTAPGRVVFTEATGPLATAVYQGGGDALATTGSLADMLKGQDRQRLLLREVTRLRNQNDALTDALRRQQERVESAERWQLKDFGHHALRAPVSAYDSSASRHAITVRAGRTDGVAVGMAVASD